MKTREDYENLLNEVSKKLMEFAEIRKERFFTEEEWSEYHHYFALYSHYWKGIEICKREEEKG